jgi:hypothetical protein
MEKRISTRDLAAIKRTAMNVAPIMAKRNKAKEMIEKYTEEYNQHEKTILNYESGIIAQTGLRTEQVVTKVTEPTGKLDKNGKEIKQTKYIINPNVRFDAETSEYVVTVKDENDNESAPVAEGDMEVAPVEQPVTEEPVAEEVAEQPEEVLENSFQF